MKNIKAQKLAASLRFCPVRRNTSMRFANSQLCKGKAADAEVSEVQ